MIAVWLVIAGLVIAFIGFVFLLRDVMSLHAELDLHAGRAIENHERRLMSLEKAAASVAVDRDAARGINSALNDLSQRLSALESAATARQRP